MYKRNQINEVLVKAIRSSHSRLSDDVILTRIKRLLDFDRKSRPPPHGITPSVFAFHDSEASGSGRDVTFSAYSAFALFVALRLMNCGLPQGRAVFALRYYRAALEREHQRMSEIDLVSMLDVRGTVFADASDAGRRRLIERGQAVELADSMVFFCVQADLEAVGITTRTIAEGGEARPNNICRGGNELIARLALDALAQSPTLVVELMNPLIQLNYLVQTTPARRGRRRGS
jgi:hypothetical protein